SKIGTETLPGRPTDCAPAAAMAYLRRPRGPPVFAEIDAPMSAPLPPNGRVLLDALMLTPELLRALPKVAVPVAGLRALIGALVAAMPFDEEFYAATYPDLAAARNAGTIADLRMHFIEHGYLEGPLGA